MTPIKETATDVAGQLQALREAYVRGLAAKNGELWDTWSRMLADGWNAPLLQAMLQLAHRLAGSGATYGFPAISESARALEEALKPIAARQTPPSSPEQTEVSARLLELSTAITAASSPDSAPLGAAPDATSEPHDSKNGG